MEATATRPRGGGGFVGRRRREFPCLFQTGPRDSSVGSPRCCSAATGRRTGNQKQSSPPNRLTLPLRPPLVPSTSVSACAIVQTHTTPQIPPSASLAQTYIILQPSLRSSTSPTPTPLHCPTPSHPRKVNTAPGPEQLIACFTAPANLSRDVSQRKRRTSLHIPVGVSRPSLRPLLSLPCTLDDTLVPVIAILQPCCALLVRRPEARLQLHRGIFPGLLAHRLGLHLSPPWLSLRATLCG